MKVIHLHKLNLEKSIAEIKARNIFKDVNYEILDGSENNLKIININVEEKPTGEISAGAGIGTSGGTFVFNVRENNWLGEGKQVGFDIDIDEESLAGTLSYLDPNYDFLGNSIRYSVSSTKMINQIKVMKIQFCQQMLVHHLSNTKILKYL